MAKITKWEAEKITKGLLSELKDAYLEREKQLGVFFTKKLRERIPTNILEIFKDKETRKFLNYAEYFNFSHEKFKRKGFWSNSQNLHLSEKIPAMVGWSFSDNNKQKLISDDDYNYIINELSEIIDLRESYNSSKNKLVEYFWKTLGTHKRVADEFPKAVEFFSDENKPLSSPEIEKVKELINGK